MPGLDHVLFVRARGTPEDPADQADTPQESVQFHNMLGLYTT
jgi:hypothetical protein